MHMCVVGLWVRTLSSMRYGQPSCRTLVPPPEGFAHTELECLCDAQAPQCNWVGATVRIKATRLCFAFLFTCEAGYVFLRIYLKSRFGNGGCIGVKTPKTH